MTPTGPGSGNSAPRSPKSLERPRGTFPIVGIGASAGGLEALERLFTGMPPDTGLAFVVVQHLSPDFRSMMDELLRRYTAMPVVRVDGETVLKPDHIYLMPARTQLVLRDGVLVPDVERERHGLFLPIDDFLRSLAGDAGQRAIAVILSGTGSDGSRGVRAIHEHGGLVLVQDEDSAKFDGMPRSAIDTGVADIVLPPQGLRDAIVSCARQPLKVGAALPPDVLRTAGERIFQLLHRETGVDFQAYKPGTVTRRIDRRLVLTQTVDLESYVQRLEEDPDELRALYRDLLIGVTSFFRDRAAYDILRTRTLPTLVQRLRDGDELRIWSVACATGEEAYSLAILASEALREAEVSATVKVLATDVHRASLEVASAGVYPMSSLSELPAELRERYFTVRGDALQARADLRGRMVFAHHNVLRDAPFTRLDLVSCRNLLIYLKPDAQKKALALLYFGLRPDGALFLGPSESPGLLADAFDTVDRRWKIYTKRGNGALPASLRPADALLSVRPRRPVPNLRDAGLDDARELLIERHAPPTLLLEEDLTLLHTFNGAGRYLAQRDGAPSVHLPDLVEGELRFAIAGAARRCMKEGRPISYDGVAVKSHHGEERVRVTCEPMISSTRRLLIASLEPREDARPEGGERLLHTDMDQVARERIEQLELELKITRENLQATGEEMEASSEELQAANEELIASNEELQSTNEELQSVNEELYSVNAEYQAKISELTELTNDMDHLLQSTEVHVVFLDRNLRIRKFTPKIAETFHLMDQDLGRRIDSFAHDLDYPDLLDDLRHVLRQGQAVEREVTDRHDRVYLLRVLPYCPHDVIQGVVLTLIDVSGLKRAETELRRSEARYRTLVRAVVSVLWSADADGLIHEPQSEWEAYTGQPFSEHGGQGWLDAIHPDDRPSVAAAWSDALQARKPLQTDGRVWNAERGEWRHFMLRGAPVLDTNGQLREWVGNLVDVEESWRSSRRLEEREQQLQGILTSSPGLIAVQDGEGRFVLTSASLDALLDADDATLLGRTPPRTGPRGLAEALEQRLRTVTSHSEVVRGEEQIELNGEVRTYLAVSFPVLDKAGSRMGMATVAEDITDRKRAEDEIQEALRQRDRFIAMMSHELRNPLGAIVNATYALEGGDTPPVQREHTRSVIKGQALHMARLLDDLLDVARISRGTLELCRRHVDLAEVVQRVVDAARLGFQRKELALELWIEDAPLTVLGDPDRLHQAVSNVLRNAHKFTPAGSVKVHVRREGDRALVEVRDTGVGMSPRDLRRMYDTFYQRENDLSRTGGGLGVGLTLTRSLLALHDGAIHAESPGLGEGATFTLELPIVEGPPDAGVASRTEAVTAPATVAIVEDNEDSRSMMKMLFELQGIEVLEASDGKAGVQLILTHRPDLAIVDIGLPELDGYEVARAIRKDPNGSALRLVALTGYGRPEDRQRALDSGFDDHLVKPVRPEDLERLIGSRPS